MRKFLLIILLSAFIPVHALCPVDYSGENICTLSDFGNKIQTTPLQQGNSIIPNPVQRPLHQLPDMTPLNIESNKINQQNQYDSACQFGVCLQDLNNTNNKNQ